MANAGKSKRNSSWMAFLAAAMFSIAGIGECLLGIRHGGAYTLLGVIFLVSGVLWIAIGVKYRRAEKQATGE